jgi:hypothetical protein
MIVFVNASERLLMLMQEWSMKYSEVTGSSIQMSLIKFMTE